jgi:hypothetical protein
MVSARGDIAAKRAESMYRKMATTLLVVLSFTAIAAADENCNWTRQPDGSNWGTCVDDNGRMYCESCPANGDPCSRVPCR